MSQPQAPDLDKRNLSSLGYVVWIVVPVVIAAIGLTILHFHYDPEDNVEGERVPILTSSFINGQANAGQLITGELVLDDQECMRLKTQDGEEITPVWPADYEATLYRDELRLYDPDRNVVARSGDIVQMGGQFQDVAAYSSNPCAPDSGDVAVVQSDVAITGKVPTGG